MRSRLGWRGQTPAQRSCSIYGPDRGLVAERARLFVSKSGIAPDDAFSLVRIDASEIERDPGRLIDEAGTVSMFSARRLIWVRDAGAHKGFADAVKCAGNNTARRRHRADRSRRSQEGRCAAGRRRGSKDGNRTALLCRRRPLDRRRHRRGDAEGRRFDRASKRGKRSSAISEATGWRREARSKSCCSMQRDRARSAWTMCLPRPATRRVRPPTRSSTQPSSESWASSMPRSPVLSRREISCFRC